MILLHHCPASVSDVPQDVMSYSTAGNQDEHLPRNKEFETIVESYARTVAGPVAGKEGKEFRDGAGANSLGICMAFLHIMTRHHLDRQDILLVPCAV